MPHIFSSRLEIWGLPSWELTYPQKRYRHLWVDDFPAFPWKVGYVSFGLVAWRVPPHQGPLSHIKLRSWRIWEPWNSDWRTVSWAKKTWCWNQWLNGKRPKRIQKKKNTLGFTKHIWLVNISGWPIAEAFFAHLSSLQKVSGWRNSITAVFDRFASQLPGKRGEHIFRNGNMIGYDALLTLSDMYMRCTLICYDEIINSTYFSLHFILTRKTTTAMFFHSGACVMCCWPSEVSMQHSRNSR